MTQLRNLGRRGYAGVFRAMREFTAARDADSADQIWLVEHDPVFTQGQAGRAEHLLAPGDIEVVASNRGGQITYHGPGQIVVYPLLDLRRLGIGPRGLVNGIEQALIDALAGWDIAAARREGAPGVYVEDAKIASIGLRVSRGCSYHGLALNVAMDLEPFSRINPCGYAGLKMTQLADFGVEVGVFEAGEIVAARLREILGC